MLICCAMQFHTMLTIQHTTRSRPASAFCRAYLTARCCTSTSLYIRVSGDCRPRTVIFKGKENTDLFYLTHFIYTSIHSNQDYPKNLSPRPLPFPPSPPPLLPLSRPATQPKANKAQKAIPKNTAAMEILCPKGFRPPVPIPPPPHPEKTPTPQPTNTGIIVAK